MWHFLNCVASGHILFCLDKKVVLKFVHHLSIFAYMILKYILENYESLFGIYIFPFENELAEYKNVHNWHSETKLFTVLLKMHL